jgi:nucleotide-binding universal stress UspA family protein
MKVLKMKKILIAVDGSETAVRATRKLVDMMPSFSKAPEIHLVNVRQPLPLGGVYVPAITHDIAKRYYEEEGEIALAPSAAVLEQAGIAYTTRVLVGDVGSMLAKYAVSEGCDVIFMGTRGMSAISNLMLGSVATKVLHLAEVPVVLVRSIEEPARGRPEEKVEAETSPA